MKLVVERQKAKTTACKQETSDSEQAKEQLRGSGAETSRPVVEAKQIEEGILKSLEVEPYKVQHQTLLPKPSQRDAIEAPAQQEQGTAASPQTGETESWQSARETVSPIIEFVSPQEPIQTHRVRKRKRTLRS